MISKADTIKQLLAAFSAESLKKELVSPIAFATGENKTAETKDKGIVNGKKATVEETKKNKSFLKTVGGLF